jgi:hypothetical protein
MVNFFLQVLFKARRFVINDIYRTFRKKLSVFSVVIRPIELILVALIFVTSLRGDVLIVKYVQIFNGFSVLPIYGLVLMVVGCYSFLAKGSSRTNWNFIFA